MPPPGTLPRGQHDLPPEYVAQHQRLRILDATTHVLGERGYGPATIADIAALECIGDAVREAYAGKDEWDARMAAGLSALMRVLVEYPHVARTCFLEARAAGVAGEKRLAAGRDMATAALQRSLTDRPDNTPVSAPSRPSRIRSVDRGLFFRSLAVQALLVGVLFAALALALPKSFFEDYGWVTGPVAWTGCSILTARILALPTGFVLFAALAGGVAGFLVGLAASHIAGLAVSLLVFAASCGGYEPAGDAEVDPTRMA